MTARMVRVHWEDASAIHGWQMPKEARKVTTARFYSIGYVVSEDKRQLVLSQSIGAEEDDTLAECDCPHAIPKRAILKIEEVTVSLKKGSSKASRKRKR